MTRIPAKDCVINNYFRDTIDPVWYRLEYCRKNCKLRCLKDLPYKQIKEVKDVITGGQKRGLGF